MEVDNHEDIEFTDSSQPKKKLKMEINDYETKAANPWAVSKLEEFLNYNCPECEFKSKEKSEFYKHAIEDHSNAQNYFKLNKDYSTDHPFKVTSYNQEAPNLFKDVKPNIVPTSSIDH